MTWRALLGGALDVIAPGHPESSAPAGAGEDFFARLDRHWANAYDQLGVPPELTGASAPDGPAARAGRVHG
ncbi:hypothetical protein [Streptomyces sp. BPTC-684]|uniref:hypothetical protein n=1 Tax=Streptomyces sp. BPTC-684 TaxID=3043734 RepID=UPI0024B248EF|nr:hypothetical protein [Streptomyces sp. BPTC-684]WHM40215.1 hypothetical protein QIY60_27395 [Streptomyces sp. BPTC-684]